MKKIKFKKPKLIFILLIISLFIIFLLYNNVVFSRYISRNIFLDQILSVSTENDTPIFTIQKITQYSGVGIEGNTPDKPLENISANQFTDIAIKIDNLGSIPDLSTENTVKSMYIDNIKTATNIGSHIFNYKNPLNFGKYETVTNFDQKIEFNIINTNEENSNTDYSKPTFFADCSNPITLSFINTNILTNYSVTENINTITYNGKILQDANISISDLNTILEFRINITNNNNEKFIYNMKLNIDLNDNNGGIYSGYQLKTTNTSGDQFRFFNSAF